jgi:hypothetical protein
LGKNVKIRNLRVWEIMAVREKCEISIGSVRSAIEFEPLHNDESFEGTMPLLKIWP